MKPLADLDHYEVLEVPRDASREEIARAYRIVNDAYAEDSLGLYSIFEGPEAAALRERVEAAYRVLSEPEARRAYDGWLAGNGSAGSRALPDFELEGAAHPPEPVSRERLARVERFEEIDVEDDEAPWDGARLRRARLLRGIEMEQIAAVTKISPTYLRFLEEECFDDLPAAVYVRGFVSAYARFLGLDAPRVATAYMQGFDAGRRGARRGRGHRA